MKHLVYTILYLLIMVCIWTDPAEAIPSAGDYTFSSTYVNGTFASTGTDLSSWSFSDTWDPSVTTNWSGPAPLLPAGSSIFQNDVALLQLVGTLHRSLGIDWGNGIVVSSRLEPAPAGVNMPFTVSAVPESSAGILLATGLLGIAGYRWSQRRREGLQVG